MSISINGSTGISGVNGSAAAPAIKGEDGDSGIFFGTNEAAITTGGTQRLTIDSTGAATFSSTVKTSKIENANTTNGGVEIDSDGHVQVDGLQLPTDGSFGYRNLVYNGACVIDQRGSTQIVSNATGAAYSVDGFQYSLRSGSIGADEYVSDFEQSNEAPTGFQNSLKITCTTAETAVENDEYYYLRHQIESDHLTRLKWGTADAKPLTVTFWVKSTVTGTFGFCSYATLGSARVFNSSYTINSANTWEKKTIVIPGDTGYVPQFNPAYSLWLVWHLAIGSLHNTAPANTSWAAYTTNNWGGGLHAVNDLVTTVNSEFYLTGVQCEVGDKATEFEHLTVEEYLARCNRYFYNPLYKTSQFAIYPITYVTASNSANIGWFVFQVDFPVAMRVEPTFTTDIANANQIGSAPVGVDNANWTFYRQNAAYIGGRVGTSDANVINSGATLTHANVGAYYISPDQEASGIIIGNGMKFQFSAEL